jgi:histidine triad (HIT) family protein
VIVRQRLVLSLPLLLRHFAHSTFRIYYTMGDCIFCKIVASEAKAAIIYKDELVTAFRDSHPVAPTHVLLVPNKHIASVNDLEPEDEVLIGHLFSVARKIAREEGIHENGYRIINNTGRDGGQSVFHIHFHLIGGQRMSFFEVIRRSL